MLLKPKEFAISIKVLLPQAIEAVTKKHFSSYALLKLFSLKYLFSS